MTPVACTPTGGRAQDIFGEKKQPFKGLPRKVPYKVLQELAKTLSAVRPGSEGNVAQG